MSQVTTSRLIGIFGTGRNGSTLLLRLLDGIADCYVHPVDITALAPFDDLAHLRTVRKRSHNNTTARPLRYLSRTLQARSLWRYFRVQADEVRQDYLDNTVEPISPGPDVSDVFPTRGAMTLSEFLPTFLDDMAAWLCPAVSEEESRKLMFKCTETSYLADYRQHFPGMKFIHIVRHPFDTWSSMKRTLMVARSRPVFYLGGNTLRSFIEYRWIPHIRFIEKHRDDPDHVIVRYEDLVRSPTEVIHRIADRLGVRPPKEPDVQTLLGGRHFKAAQFNPSQPGVRTPERAAADLATKHRYESVITEREKALIRYRSGTLADGLSYLGDQPTVEKSALVRQWLDKDEWDRRNLSGIGDALRLHIMLAKRQRYLRDCAPADI